MWDKSKQTISVLARPFKYWLTFAGWLGFACDICHFLPNPVIDRSFHYLSFRKDDVNIRFFHCSDRKKLISIRFVPSFFYSLASSILQINPCVFPCTVIPRRSRSQLLSSAISQDNPKE